MAHWHTLKIIVQLKLTTASLSFWVAHWHTTQVHCTGRIKTASLFRVAHLHTSQVHCSARIQNCISLFLGGTLAHNSSPLSCSNSKRYIFVFWWHTGTPLKSIERLEFKTVSFVLVLGGTLAHDSSPLYCSNSKLSLFLFKWHTGTQLKSIERLKLQTDSFCFWVAHWHTTQVYCRAKIQNSISFFSGGTRAHKSILLYLANSIMYVFVCWCYTGTRLKYIVHLQFTTLSLSFQVAHLHTTQVYCTAQIKNCISLFSGGTLAHDSSKFTVLLEFITVSLCFRVAHWHTTHVNFKAQIKICISFFLGGTLAHVSSPMYCLNVKLNLSLFRWHTGTQLKYIVQHEFKTVSLSFLAAH
jgi:hypothetical protein